MLRYVARRTLATVLVLVAASALTFVLVDRVMDPLTELRTRQPPVPQVTLDAVRQDLYLDRGLPERYWIWLTGLGDTHGDVGLLRGHWGPSVDGTDIGDELRDRFGVTFRLVGASVVLAVGLALVTGVVGGSRPGSRRDRTLSGFAYVALAVPVFWLGALVKQAGVWFNDLVGRRVLWTFGSTSPDHASMGVLSRFGDIVGHLVLPTVTLVVASYALISRQQRAAIIVSLEGDHVRTARAKGLGDRAVVLRHALRPALGPTVSLTALLVSEALAGSVIVERIFRWRGLGTYLLDALAAGDTYAVLGYVVVAAVVVCLANLVADVVLAALTAGAGAMTVASGTATGTLRRFADHRGAVVALGGLVLLGLFAFVGPSLWSFGHTLHRDLPIDQAPTWAHPFGTDRAGHDLFGQVMRGTRQSLLVGFGAVALGTAIGTTVGLVAAFRRGWVDAVLMRLVEVTLVVPSLVVVLVVAGSTQGTSWLRVAVLIGVVSWPRPARLVRGLALSEQARDYVEAARAMGYPSRRILFRHVLPNVVPAVAVDATFAVTLAILAESALSFLGFGFTVPDTSLGLLVSTGQAAIATRPWLFYIPGAFLTVLCVLVHLVGDGLRAAVGERR